jgi:hypothetical protein
MKQKPELLYLDLMKKTLSFTLWPDPPIPITTSIYRKSPIQKLLVSLISKILDMKKTADCQNTRLIRKPENRGGSMVRIC